MQAKLIVIAVQTVARLFTDLVREKVIKKKKS